MNPEDSIQEDISKPKCKRRRLPIGTFIAGLVAGFSSVFIYKWKRRV